MKPKIREGAEDRENRSDAREPRTVTEKQLMMAIEGSKGSRCVVAGELHISLSELGELLKKYPAAKDALACELEAFLFDVKSLAREGFRKLVRRGDARATAFALNRGRK